MEKLYRDWCFILIREATVYLRKLDDESAEKLREAARNIINYSQSAAPYYHSILSFKEQVPMCSVALKCVGYESASQLLLDRIPSAPLKMTSAWVKDVLELRDFSSEEIIHILNALEMSSAVEEDEGLKVVFSKIAPSVDLTDIKNVVFLAKEINENFPPHLIARTIAFGKDRWQEKFAWIMEKCNYDKEEAWECLKLILSQEVFDARWDEVLSVKGNPEALRSMLHRRQVTRGSSTKELRPLEKEMHKKLFISAHKMKIIDEKILSDLILHSAAINSLEVQNIVLNYELEPAVRHGFLFMLAQSQSWPQLIAYAEPRYEQLSKTEATLYYEAAFKLNHFEVMLQIMKDKEISTNLGFDQIVSYMIRKREFGVLFDYVSRQHSTLKIREALQKPALYTATLEDFSGMIDAVSDRHSDMEILLTYCRELIKENKKRDLIDRALAKGVEYKNPEITSLYAETYPEREITSDLLEIIAKSSTGYIAQRELAKIYIKEGRLEEARELATKASFYDDEAAHLLLHVLEGDVTEAQWALYRRGSSFRTSFYRDTFEAAGFTVKNQTELESSELHNLYFESDNKRSPSKKVDEQPGIETWVCRQVFTQSGKLEWNNSCESHREDMEKAYKKGEMKNPNAEEWKLLTQVVKANSLAMSEESLKSYIEKSGGMPLRDWQAKALQVWTDHGRVGIVEAATGSGKSRLGVIAALEAMSEGFAVVIVAPSRILQQQWIKDYFSTLWEDPNRKIFTMGNKEGEFQRDIRELRPGSITVAVVDTFQNRIDSAIREGLRVLLIADEVHNYTGPRDRLVLDERFERRLGLTATLDPPKNRYPILSNYFGGHPIYSYEFADAVREKVISPYQLILLRVPMESQLLNQYTIEYERMKKAKHEILSSSEYSELNGHFERRLMLLKERKVLSSIIQRYEDAFEESDQLLRNSKSKAGAIASVSNFVKSRGGALVFCDFIKTAENVNEILYQRHISTAYLDKDVDQSMRTIYFRRFDEGTIQALVAPKVLDEGVDIKLASIGIFAGTTRRRLQTIQRLGRVLRTDPRKKTPVIIVPVMMGTEEDPKRPGNEQLQESVFNIVFERSDSTPKVFDVDEQDNIESYLERL